MKPGTTSMAFLLLVAPLLAQAQFTDLGRTHFPADGAQSRGVALGDVNGDGHVDVVSLVGTTSQPGPAPGIWIYLNDGTGIFRQASHIMQNGKPLLADVDRDGDLDLLIGTFLLLPNDGRGNFGSTSLNLPAMAAEDPVFGDVDGDGDLDLVLDAPAPLTQSALLWLNDGRGNFTDGSNRMPASGRIDTNEIVLVDVDGDRDLDVVLANMPYLVSMMTRMPGPTRLFLNNGQGTFTDATANNLPNDPNDLTLGVLARDFDLDGDVDLVLANHTSQNRLYLNDGKGVFSDATGARMPSTSGAMMVVNADRNGLPDLVGQESGVPTLYLNRVVGFQKAPAQAMPGNLLYVGLGGSADVDADGDFDLVLLDSRQHKLLLNDGSGRFVDATAAGVWRPRRPTALGDVDGDGDVDLVFGSDLSTSGTSALLYLNDGDGNFVPPASGGMPQDPHHILAPTLLVDMDGDSDLDLFCLAATSNPVTRFPKLYRNDGRGNFTDVTAQQIPAQATLGQADGGSLAVGDVDGDGDADFVLGVSGKPDLLFVNNGRGFFTLAAGRLPARNDPTGPVLLADVDGDRDLDLVLAQLNWSGTSPTRLYLNDGRGRFTDATAGRLPNVISNSFSVEAGDVDRDGDVDVFLGEYLAGGRLYLNDGKGRFQDAGPRLPQGLLGEFSELGDVDGDGDLDLMVDGRLLTNLHVHLHAPLLARPGRPYTLDVYSRPGYAPPGQLAVPLASWFRTSIPVPPLGVLRVNPATLVILPTVAIAQNTGKASLSFPMPNNPALAGYTVFVQALVAPTANTGSWRLTNLVADTFRR